MLCDMGSPETCTPTASQGREASARACGGRRNHRGTLPGAALLLRSAPVARERHVGLTSVPQQLSPLKLLADPSASVRHPDEASRDFLWIGGIEYGTVCVRAGGHLGLGAVCLGLVVGRLCVGLLTGLVVRGDVGPVGRREVVDVVDSLGGLPRSRAPAVHPAPPCPRLAPPLFPTSAPPLPPTCR